MQGLGSLLDCVLSAMRSIFCGNFEYDARQSDLERLFQRYGKVDRVDMKSGKFCWDVFAYYCYVLTIRILWQQMVI